MSGRAPRWISKAQSNGYTVTLSGTFDSSCAYASIGDAKYTSAATVEVEKDANVVIHVSALVSFVSSSCYVTLNGDTVQSGAGDYTLTITGTTNIVFLLKKTGDFDYGACEITTS